uniref:Uncharacterized protein n=1 Tax=Onchocerca volvulus TaxID=6282 RepID=A0A8R1TVQ6_ONCVO
MHCLRTSVTLAVHLELLITCRLKLLSTIYVNILPDVAVRKKGDPFLSQKATEKIWSKILESPEVLDYMCQKNSLASKLFELLAISISAILRVTVICQADLFSSRILFRSILLSKREPNSEKKLVRLECRQICDTGVPY